MLPGGEGITYQPPPPGHQPHRAILAVDLSTTLKERLLLAHQLTDFQRAEAFFYLLALGGRKPTAKMGSEKCILFRRQFLRRIPQQLRMLLLRADFSNIKGRQADELWTHNAAKDLVVQSSSCPLMKSWWLRCSPVALAFRAPRP